jgi:hypothetical protein
MAWPWGMRASTPLLGRVIVRRQSHSQEGTVAGVSSQLLGPIVRPSLEAGHGEEGMVTEHGHRSSGGEASRASPFPQLNEDLPPNYMGPVVGGVAAGVVAYQPGAETALAVEIIPPKGVDEGPAGPSRC